MDHKKKLLYRSQKTGLRELDLILGNFLKRNINSLSKEEISAYEALLFSYQELEIYHFISQNRALKSSSPEIPEEICSIVDKIRRDLSPKDG